MRLTKANVYWSLTAIVPLVACCLLIAIASQADETPPKADPRVGFAFYTFTVVIFLSFVLFPALALRERPWFNRQFLTHRVWLVSGANAILLVLIALIVGLSSALAITAGHLKFDDAAAWTPFFLSMLLLLMLPLAFNAIAELWTERNGGQRPAISLSCIFPMSPMMDLEPQQAGEQWATMWRVPTGGVLDGAWIYLDTQAVRVHSRDSEGTRWTLLRRLPQVPWPKWTAGCFIEASRHWGDARTRHSIRLFKRWEVCKLRPLETLPPVLPPNAPGLVGQQCLDCGAIHMEAIGTEGTRFFATAAKEYAPESLWLAGFMLTFCRTPRLPRIQ